MSTCFCATMPVFAGTCSGVPRSARPCTSSRPHRAPAGPAKGLRLSWSRSLLVRASSSGSELEGDADPFKWKIKKYFQASDGKKHLGSALQKIPQRPFPGPPPAEGPPLRILPIGGLGEIGMNCMLVGVRDRYILIDAGLMFPDMQDLGMQKILPDISFLAEWRDKIEAVVITHGHEDHIGAMPWVVPALDPSTPIYAGAFVLQLVTRRLQEFNLYDPARFRVMEMKQPFTAGPFEVTPIRVTHSIPDCCGLIMRSSEGTIVHTGDWKIDENPVDGEIFDRETFDLLSKEPISLMMSDSTNVLSPGRTSSERVVQDALTRWVVGHQGKGRVICTQFASNLHRIASVKAAADAAGRKICFIGMSLHTYLEAASRVGRAPIDPKDILPVEALADYNPNDVLIVTTGSQGEPQAQLSLASRAASRNLKIIPSDLLLYSAKVIPGNEPQVSGMLNSLALLGAQVVQGRGENLHTSGHAYQEELLEVMRYVKPQHFLPVHGEYAFLCEHARLAKEKAEVNFTEVIRNGQMLGVYERRNRNTISTGSMAVAGLNSSMGIIGEVPLVNFYNDGSRGTGTRDEMAVDERATLAFEGIVVVAIDVLRTALGAAVRGGGQGPAPVAASLRCHTRVTTRGMWLDNGQLLDKLTRDVSAAVCRLPGDASLTQVERVAIDIVRKACRFFNNRAPEVIAVAYEHDPRYSNVVRFTGGGGPPPPPDSQSRGYRGNGRGDSRGDTSRDSRGDSRGSSWDSRDSRDSRVAGQQVQRPPRPPQQQQQGWGDVYSPRQAAKPAAAAGGAGAAPVAAEGSAAVADTTALSSSAAPAAPSTAGQPQERAFASLLGKVRQQQQEEGGEQAGQPGTASPAAGADDADTTTTTTTSSSSSSAPPVRKRTTAAQRRAQQLAAAAAAAVPPSSEAGPSSSEGRPSSTAAAAGDGAPVKRRRTRRSTAGDDAAAGGGEGTSAGSSSRRVARRGSSSSGSSGKALPALQVLDPAVLEAVKARNPRQAPGSTPGEDLAYD